MTNNPPLATEAPSLANTAAVVVLFRPEGDLADRLRRVLSQVAWLVIVSNDDEKPERLGGLDTDKYHHLQSRGNIGLAAALNQGLAHAAMRGFSWCLLLDQDTVIDEDLLTGLAETYAACPDRNAVGVLVPNYRSPGGARLAYPSGVASQSVETAVTSGSLVALATVRQVGGMRDAFFIEGIDVEFSLRVRAAGLQLIASGRPLMTHGAGSAEERRFLGRTVLVGHHPPWRCFMQFRNLAWTLWHYGGHEPHWARTTLLAIVKRLCIVVLFEQQRARKLWAMLRGTISGLVGAFQSNTKPGDLPALE